MQTKLTKLYFYSILSWKSKKIVLKTINTQGKNAFFFKERFKQNFKAKY